MFVSRQQLRLTTEDKQKIWGTFIFGKIFCKLFFYKRKQATSLTDHRVFSNGLYKAATSYHISPSQGPLADGGSVHRVHGVAGLPGGWYPPVDGIAGILLHNQRKTIILETDQ